MSTVEDPQSNQDTRLITKVFRRGRYDIDQGELQYKSHTPYFSPANVRTNSIYDTSSLKVDRDRDHKRKCDQLSVPYQKVLVTGASGFIASHCIRLLLEQGYQVRGTVRSLSDTKKIAPLYQLCPNAKHRLELVEANLLEEASWSKAVVGCTFVLHVASPFPNATPDDEQVLIKPAVEGTLNVLRACAATGGVKRVVLTSSVASIAGQNVPDYNKVYSEIDWTDLSTSVAYPKSKTLAEQAAWNFVKNLTESSKFELAVINPSYVMGPICHGTVGTSQELISRLMKREVPAIPNIGMEMCDVRDVALAHVRAMTIPEAAGQRFIVNTGGLFFKDVADTLDREFKDQGYKVPTTMAPKFLVSIASLFDKTLQAVMPRWGKTINFDNTKMRKFLKIEPVDSQRTIIDMAYSMIENELLPKTAEYRGSKTPISLENSAKN